MSASVSRHIPQASRNTDFFTFAETDVNRIFPQLSSVVDIATNEYLRICGLNRKREETYMPNLQNWNDFIVEFDLNLQVSMYNLLNKRYYLLRVGGGEQDVSEYWRENFYTRRRNPRRRTKTRIFVDDLWNCFTLCAMQQECPRSCLAGDLCCNKQISKKKWKKVQDFVAGNKGKGLKTLEDIKAGDFVIEYCGEMVTKENLKNRDDMSYIMALNDGNYIDALSTNCKAKFLNHSCEPNCFLQVWDVSGTSRVGVFSLRAIVAEEELTIDYRWLIAGGSKTKCFCESKNCRGTIEINKS